MPKPDPMQSVAQLLEQILSVSQQSLAVQQEQLQNAQATNTQLQKSNAMAKQQLDVAAATLESSKRIEKLLGGGETPSVPSMIKVVYQHVLETKGKK